MDVTFGRRVRRVGLGVCAFVIAASALALAQNTNPDPRPFRGRGGMPGGPGMPGPGGMLPMLGPRLNLTDAQKDQVKNISTAHKDEWKGLTDRAMAAHRALMDASTTGASDESVIRKLSADAAAVDADLAVARARAFDEVWAILTPDQQAQVKAKPGPPRGRR
jgi:Spy/CpxP family protein refolding chaperone